MVQLEMLNGPVGNADESTLSVLADAIVGSVSTEVDPLNGLLRTVCEVNVGGDVSID